MSSKRPVTRGECFKIFGLQPHFNCVHDGRPAFEKVQTKLKLGFSTSNRKVSEIEDLSSPTEDQIQCDSCDNETPFASVESPPSFLPAYPPLFRPSSSTLPSLESNENLIGQMKVLLEKLVINVRRDQRTLLPRNLKVRHFLHLFSGKPLTLNPRVNKQHKRTASRNLTIMLEAYSYIAR